MKKLIVANWKMNPQTEKEAEAIIKSVTKLSKNVKNTDVVICAPFIFLSAIRRLKSRMVQLGAQNVAQDESGAHTGEVSASMLSNAKARYCIVGHSERRSMGESDEMISKKLNVILKSRITPILCVGETTRTPDGAYLHVVKDQITSCLSLISKNYIKEIVIAYEPVWALSTTENRRDATPHDFEEMRIYIRKILTDMYSPLIAQSIRILYGGSVTKDTAGEFLHAGADGLLVGKASLDPKNFAAIIHSAGSTK